MKILIVDDSPAIIELLEYALKTFNFQITVADSGIQALRLTDQHLFDLVISDVNMPVMDGISFGLEFRKSHPTIPIIYFSAEPNGHSYYRSVLEKIGHATFIEKNVKKLLDLLSKNHIP